MVNLGNGRVVASLAGHQEDTSVEAVAFSRHLQHVAMSGGMDGQLLVWDLNAAVASTRATCQHPEVGWARGTVCWAAGMPPAGWMPTCCGGEVGESPGGA